jgi:3-phenylpropionate/trans-cinnamate dioxygenase ferredoxin component
MEWIKVCDEKSLNDGDLVGFDYQDNIDNKKKKLLIAKIHGKIYATDGICTHEYAELSSGFLNEEEKTVTCPLHLSVFNLDNGSPLNPPAEKPLKTYEVKVNEDDGGVYVLLKC